jgi:hypothetical protein
VRDGQSVRRGRLENQQPEVVAVGQLARAERVMANPLDDQLQESPAVGVRFADQDSCHVPHTIDDRGRKEAAAEV